MIILYLTKKKKKNILTKDLKLSGSSLYNDVKQKRGAKLRRATNLFPLRELSLTDAVDWWYTFFE